MIAAFLAGARREIAFLRGSFWDLFLVVWLPLALLALVAVQMSAGVMRDLPVAVVDADGGSVARDLVRRLDASPGLHVACLLYTSPSPRDATLSRMPSSA